MGVQGQYGIPVTCGNLTTLLSSLFPSQSSEIGFDPRTDRYSDTGFVLYFEKLLYMAENRARKSHSTFLSLTN